MRVDLNADVGESYGAYVIGDDEALLASLTSASIAAGFHAGDPRVLRRTIRLAHRYGVSVGAHPGFPDLAGFGRREMRLSPDEAEDLVLYQIAAVAVRHCYVVNDVRHETERRTRPMLQHTRTAATSRPS